MDIVFLVLSLAAGLLLARSRALLVVVGLWAVAVAMVGWGPAGNADVHTDSAGFWVPWSVALVIGLGLAWLMSYLRQRRRASLAQPHS